MSTLSLSSKLSLANVEDTPMADAYPPPSCQSLKRNYHEISTRKYEAVIAHEECEAEFRRGLAVQAMHAAEEEEQRHKRRHIDF
jgi:hypothetical protein